MDSVLRERLDDLVNAPTAQSFCLSAMSFGAARPPPAPRATDAGPRAGAGGSTRPGQASSPGVCRCPASASPPSRSYSARRSMRAAVQV